MPPSSSRDSGVPDQAVASAIALLVVVSLAATTLNILFVPGRADLVPAGGCAGCGAPPLGLGRVTEMPSSGDFEYSAQVQSVMPGIAWTEARFEVRVTR